MRRKTLSRCKLPVRALWSRTVPELSACCAHAAARPRAVSEHFDDTLRRLEREAARPASARLPLSSGPVPGVLKATRSLVFLQDLPSVHEDDVCTVILTRFVSDEGNRMYMGFNLKFKKPFRESETANVFAARLPWQREYGTSWTPVHFAWLIALVLGGELRLRNVVTSVSLSYKLRDCPQSDFRDRVKRLLVTCAVPNRWPASEALHS